MKRLIDDPEIAGELRTEMQRYATEQAQVDLKRVYTGLQASLPLAAAAPSSVAQARISRSAWSGLPSATKLLIVAALGGTVALGISALRGDEQVASKPAAVLPSTVSTQPTAVDAPQPASTASAQASPPTTATPPAPMIPSSSGGGIELQPRAAASDAEAPKARIRSTASSASRREIAQLARIKELLEKDPAAAHRLIRAAQREFPAGLLVEEREGLDVIALFALEETERARNNAQRFVARYPQSPLRPKVERLIADASE
jgi:hypothetical protein